MTSGTTAIPHEYRYLDPIRKAPSKWLPCQQLFIQSQATGIYGWIYFPHPDHSGKPYEVRIVQKKIR